MGYDLTGTESWCNISLAPPPTKNNNKNYFAGRSDLWILKLFQKMSTLTPLVIPIVVDTISKLMRQLFKKEVVHTTKNYSLRNIIRYEFLSLLQKTFRYEWIKKLLIRLWNQYRNYSKICLTLNSNSNLLKLYYVLTWKLNYCYYS